MSHAATMDNLLWMDPVAIGQLQQGAGDSANDSGRGRRANVLAFIERLVLGQ